METKLKLSGFQVIDSDHSLSKILKQKGWKDTCVDKENRINTYTDSSGLLIGFTVFPQQNTCIHYIKK